MELGLSQKNVLITGSSRGIGFAMAQAFLNEGANVLVNGRSNEMSIPLKSIRDKQLFYIAGDVSTIEGINTISKNISTVFQNKLDILICNVGSGKSVPPGSEVREDWNKSFETNFFSTTSTIEGLKKFLTPGSGNILCISSICGLEVVGAPLTYSAAKAALNSYVVGASRVFSRDGVRINAIAPGNILFEGSTWDNKIKENKKAVQDMLDREVALKKLGDVEDVANMALFLSSEKAKFITGTINVVDGGQVRAW